MKTIIICLISILLYCGCASVRTTSKDIVSYKWIDNPIEEFNIIENKTTIRDNSNLFPCNRSCMERDYITCIVANVVTFGIPLGVDLIALPFQLLYNSITSHKTYFYKIKLSIDGKIVNRDNEPIKNKVVLVKYLNKIYTIITDDKGFIKETIEFETSRYNNKQEISRQIEFKFDSNNPRQISYSYPFKEGKRYIIDKNSKKIESKIKAEGKVIVIDQIK